MSRARSIAVVGTVGLPPRYGGFETLAANLVAYHDAHHRDCPMAVYCSGSAYPQRSDTFGGATLRYVPLAANGVSSILYDIWSLADAARRGDGTILVLGVSGAVVLPLIRLVSRARLVVNIDGLEWRRPKWGRAAALYLRLAEWLAVRSAHVVVADNRGIAEHVRAAYGRVAAEIPYGGDHATRLLPGRAAQTPVRPYALMLCRIEPENNIHLVLEAFAAADAIDLVAVGNWDTSGYGRSLRARFADARRIRLLDPVFEPATLSDIRAGASLYVHGHSAGGTNPALVEMMHFATPVAAFDCSYNRHTTEQKATYFRDVPSLVAILRDESDSLAVQGRSMREIALRRYTWDRVGAQYFELLLPTTPG